MPVTTINQQCTATAGVNWLVGTLIWLFESKLRPTKEPGPSNALDSKPSGFERRFDYNINRLSFDNLPSDWVNRENWPPLYAKRKTTKSKRLLLYYHGGGFVNAIMPPQWNMIGLLASKLDADIMLQTYIMAPHGGVHQNIDKLVRCYENCHDIVKQENQEFILCGDSAGGAITASMLLALSDRDLPLPDQAILLAPCWDMNIEDPGARAIEPNDPILSIDKFSAVCRAWATGPIQMEQVFKPAATATPAEVETMKNHIASPMYGDWTFAAKSSLPITLSVGTHDILVVQNDRWVEKVRPLNLELTYIRAETACHVYPMLADLPLANWIAPDSVEGMKLIVESVERYSARN